jgi:uncharacterized protein
VLLSNDVALWVFLVGTLVAAFVASIAGFAFGLVALAIWLHALSPMQAMPLIAAYALPVQGYAVWRLRHCLDWKRLQPILLGSIVGAPMGLVLLNWASTAALRSVVGVLLIAFSGYGLARPTLHQIGESGWGAEIGIGVLNGIIGGSTGLAGIVVVVWSAMRAWTRDEQRAVFQPAAVATFLVIMILLGSSGAVTAETAWLFVLGLPALAGGTWVGWRLYGVLEEATFRRVVLLLLLVSGATLIAIPR